MMFLVFNKKTIASSPGLRRDRVPVRPPRRGGHHPRARRAGRNPRLPGSAAFPGRPQNPPQVPGGQAATP